MSNQNLSLVIQRLSKGKKERCERHLRNWKRGFSDESHLFYSFYLICCFHFGSVHRFPAEEQKKPEHKEKERRKFEKSPWFFCNRIRITSRAAIIRNNCCTTTTNITAADCFACSENILIELCALRVCSEGTTSTSPVKLEWINSDFSLRYSMRVFEDSVTPPAGCRVFIFMQPQGNLYARRKRRRWNFWPF